MSIKRIYNEFSQGFEDEYYIKLARDDVMAVPVLIDIMLDDNFFNARWAQNILEQISENFPETVYPFYKYVADALNNENKFLAWNVWKIIVNLTAVDDGAMWNMVSDRFYASLNSEFITEFSIACDCAERIIVNKSDESEKILNVLKNINNRIFKIGGEISESSLAVAKEKVDQLLEKIIAL